MNKGIWGIILGFSLVILLMNGVSYFIVNSSGKINETLYHQEKLLNKKESLVFKMRESQFQRITLLRDMFLIKDPFELDEKQLEFFGLERDIILVRDELLTVLNTEERIILEGFFEIGSKNAPLFSHIIDSLLDEVKPEELVDTLKEAFENQKQTANILSNLLISLQQQRESSVNSAINNNRNIQDTTIKSSLLATVLALMTIVAVVIYNRKQTKSLENSKIKAEKANVAKSQFLAVMSHEIRTPMNGVLGMAQLLEGTELSEVQKGYVSTINDSGESLLHIINDILDFSKLESEMTEIEKIPLNLKDVVDKAVELYQFNAKEKGFQLVVKYRLNTEEYIFGDSTRLRQVILNLISNAIKFTDQGKVEIDVSVDSSNHRYSICVSDTGIGMSEEAQQKLFKAFTQADQSTTRKYGGTGLGLAISQKLINLMNGKIYVNSVEGKGTQFTLELPLEYADQASVEGHLKAELPKHKKSPMNSKEVDNEVENFTGNVLLVEDVPTNQLVAKIVIESLGMTVDLANNGEEAIEKWQNNSYKLIFMDCQMPVLDGYEATEQIRKIESESNSKSLIPIIALTANVTVEDKELCLNSGMNDVLPKPFKKEQIGECLSQWI